MTDHERPAIPHVGDPHRPHWLVQIFYGNPNTHRWNNHPDLEFACDVHDLTVRRVDGRIHTPSAPGERLLLKVSSPTFRTEENDPQELRFEMVVSAAGELALPTTFERFGYGHQVPLKERWFTASQDEWNEMPRYTLFDDLSRFPVGPIRWLISLRYGYGAQVIPNPDSVTGLFSEILN